MDVRMDGLTWLAMYLVIALQWPKIKPVLVPLYDLQPINWSGPWSLQSQGPHQAIFIMC